MLIATLQDDDLTTIAHQVAKTLEPRILHSLQMMRLSAAVDTALTQCIERELRSGAMAARFDRAVHAAVQRGVDATVTQAITTMMNDHLESHGATLRDVAVAAMRDQFALLVERVTNALSESLSE